ncbi:MAG TPA: hypothetical protein VKB49_21255 [Candidatus Sulfotelmatobacter sp.]|nr:hypothetical protein [Candidatus Sulfotelmatobacter sp.]
MTLHLFDDVFGLNLTFESTEGILQGFALLQSDFCHAHSPKLVRYGSLVADSQAHNLCLQGINLAYLELELLVDVAILVGRIRGVLVSCAEIEERRLLCGMLVQFSHLVDAACNRLLLFSLIPALCFVPLSLLPCMFLLALCKC